VIKTCKILLFILGAAIALLFICNCTPQKRLNRLVKNHPELVKTDTVYSSRTFTVPGRSIDTSFAQNTDVTELYKIIDAYKELIAAPTRQKLDTVLKNYIISRPCLRDTFTVPLQNHGHIKIWQAGNIHFKLYEPPYTRVINLPMIVNNLTAHPKYAWPFFTAGFFSAWLIMLFLIIYFKLRINLPPNDSNK